MCYTHTHGVIYIIDDSFALGLINIIDEPKRLIRILYFVYKTSNLFSLQSEFYLFGTLCFIL